MRTAAASLACVASMGLAGGCATFIRPLAYTPAELRAEVLQRAPDFDTRELVVPFDVPPEAVERARRVVAPYGGEADQIKALIEALLSRRGFGLQYAPIVTASATDTLATKRGNCLALASVFVGLARAVGLKALYVDASARVTEVSQAAPGLVVNSGHITAMIESNNRRWYLDFDRTLGPVANLRVIDDLEALAHFYNNRGFEQIAVAMLDEDSIDWNQAARDFERAAAVSPGFSRAWNNLGLARSRVGRVSEAERAYKRALTFDPKSGAVYNNLGSLYLAQHRIPEAIDALRNATRLEPKRAYVHVNLGRAYILAHDLEAAHNELAIAAELRDDSAKRLLGKIALYEEAQRRAAEP